MNHKKQNRLHDMKIISYLCISMGKKGTSPLKTQIIGKATNCKIVRVVTSKMEDLLSWTNYDVSMKQI